MPFSYQFKIDLIYKNITTHLNLGRTVLLAVFEFLSPHLWLTFFCVFSPSQIVALDLIYGLNDFCDFYVSQYVFVLEC